MPTKVYLDIKNNVVVEKTGASTLTIPQSRAKFTLFGFYPIEDIESYTDVKIVDLLTEDFITDKTNKVQDSTGAFVGNTSDVKAYLEGFILRSDARALQEECSTKANQETIISQNEENEVILTSLDDKLNNLNDVIEQLDINNELLKGISS